MSGSWLGHSQDLSEHLALMLATSEPTRTQDLDLALHARSAVLELAAAVHHDVTGMRRKWHRPVRESVLYEHPVVYLGRLLDEQRRPRIQRSLIESLADQPNIRASPSWRDVVRSATAAHHEWSRLEEADRRLDASAWTAMHQLAQHCLAVGWLDESLERDCRHAGRRDQAERLLDSASRLRPAAASVIHLAASAPLEHLPNLKVDLGRRALVVPGVEQLPRGIERLTELVASSEHVGPLQVQASFRVLGRVVQRAVALWDANASFREPAGGRTLVDGLGIDVATAMVDHALTLRRSARDPGRVRSLRPDDALVAAQIDQLSLAVGAAQPALWRGTPGAAVDFAGQVATSSVRATYALGEVVSSSLADSRWLVPAGERDPLRFSWVFASPQHALLDDPDCPTLLKSSGLACAQANAVSDALSTVSFPSQPPARSRDASTVDRRAGALLAAALRDAERGAMPAPARPPVADRPLTR